MDTLNSIAEKGISISYFNEDLKLPLLIKAEKDIGKAFLQTFIESNHAQLRQTLNQDGAILFRGFNIESAQDFEDVARLIDPNLKNNYLGTSPRNSITKYVFSASELPPHYPIMQHCEMSFLPNPPEKLFFFCETAPENGGETPIVDFRKVYAELDPKIRQVFEEKGIKNIRNYDGPETKTNFDFWKLKRWDEMFLTQNRQEAEKIARSNGLEVVWEKNGKLRLINDQEAVTVHPETEEKVWFNHLQVFHRSAAKLEYQKIYRQRKNLSNFFYAGLVSLLTSIKSTFKKPEEEGMHCTFRDGSEIPPAYLKHLSDVIWKNMSIFEWKKGDIIVIDNLSTSHGRLPYKGNRNVLVCWSAAKS